MQQLVWEELNLPLALNLTRGIIQVILKEYQRFQIHNTVEMLGEVMPLVRFTHQIMLVKYQQVDQGLLRLTQHLMDNG